MKPIRLMLTLAVAISAMAPTLGAQSITAALTQLESSDYHVRRAGFYQITRIANAGRETDGSLRPLGERLAQFSREHPKVRTALIRLLEREILPDPAKDDLSEDGYLGDLIGCVAALRDPRAVNGLLGVVNTGGMAQEGLAALGQAAVPGLLAKLRSRDHFFQRSAAADVLGIIAESRSDQTADRANIRRGLLVALADTNLYVRRSAVVALSSFRDAEVRRGIEVLATTDTATAPGRTRYPVRAAASAWIRRDDSLRAPLTSR